MKRSSLRVANAPLSLAFSALLGACSGAADAPPPPASATAPMTLLAQAASAGIVATAVAPTFGGKVAVAGPSVVEVMPRADGLILAEVRDASGAIVVDGMVSVQLTGTDNQQRTVPLRYDSDLRVFEGNAGVTLQPAPANLSVTVQPAGGQPSVVTLAQVPVAPLPANGGQVVLVGGIAPEVRLDANGSVHAFLPEAGARLPSGDLYVNVDVGEPAPRRVRLDYVEAEGHYVAQLGPTAHPAGGTLSVELEANGQVEHGRTVYAVVAPPSRLGGTVVVAGNYGVEVAPVDGELQATISDSSGVYVSAPPPTVEVYVESQRAPVVMRWDVSRRVYVAPLPPRVDFETAPFRVEVRSEGRRHRGSVRVHARGRGRGHGQVRAGATAGPTATAVQVVGAPPQPGRVDVRINAPAPPRVDVRINAPAPPRVDVRVNAPAPPRATVRVNAPAPQGSVRVHGNNGVGQGRGGGREDNRGRGGDRGRDDHGMRGGMR